MKLELNLDTASDGALFVAINQILMEIAKRLFTRGAKK